MMASHDDFENDWKENLARAAARLIVSVTAMVPLIAAAVILSILLHEVLSEPGGFTCKSLPRESAKALKHRFDRNKVAPVRPAPEVTVTPLTEIPIPESPQE